MIDTPVSKYRNITLETFTLVNTPINFTAGKTNICFEKWAAITSDTNILACVSGVTIDFHEVVKQEQIPEPIHFIEPDKEKINNKITKLLSKNIIEPTQHEEG